MVAVVVVNDGSLKRAGFAGDEGPRAVFLPITDRSKKPSIEVKIATDVDASEFCAAEEKINDLDFNSAPEMKITEAELAEYYKARTVKFPMIDLWMKVNEQDYQSILRLRQYFLETWPTITIELVNPITAMVGDDSRSVTSEFTFFVEEVKELGSMQSDIDHGQTIRVLQLVLHLENF